MSHTVSHFHRRLGKIGFALAMGIALLGAFTGIMAVARGTMPPFFAPGYFLALTNVGMAVFAGLIVAAVRMRRDTEWHRRLMLVALIFILEPALGRILPMPLLQPFAQWWELAFQLLFLGFAMGHDLKHRGAIHPAFKLGAVILIGFHVVIFGLSHLPPWIALAAPDPDKVGDPGYWPKIISVRVMMLAPSTVMPTAE